jgi:hypothetical protein
MATAALVNCTNVWQGDGLGGGGPNTKEPLDVACSANPLPT